MNSGGTGCDGSDVHLQYQILIIYKAMPVFCKKKNIFCHRIMCWCLTKLEKHTHVTVIKMLEKSLTCLRHLRPPSPPNPKYRDDTFFFLSLCDLEK